MQEVVHERLRIQPKDIFLEGIQALMKQWRTCMEHSRDCAEI
jgi:hypothetical protein